jgi:mannose-6-phosphate isomerase-like protein (cupin superfamily)
MDTDIESTKNRPEGERTIDTSQLLIDIPSFIKQIKREKQWKKGDRNAITVFKSEKMRIVLTGLRKKAEMHTQHPENVLSLFVIDGRISLKAQSKKIKIGSGQMLALHEKVPYSITATKKTMLLLTIVE